MGRKVSIDLDKEEEQAKVERKGGEESQRKSAHAHKSAGDGRDKQVKQHIQSVRTTHGNQDDDR